MASTNGELAVFTLLHNYYYSNKVCQAIVDLSNDRVSELERKIRETYSDDDDFRFDLANLAGKKFLIEALAKKRYLENTETSEVELMIQLEQNIKKAEIGIKLLTEKYTSQTEIEALSQRPDSELTGKEINDKAYWIHYTNTILNGGLATEPINHKPFQDNELNIEIFSTISNKDVYLIAHVNERKNLEKKTQEIRRLIDENLLDSPEEERIKLGDLITSLVHTDLMNIIYKHKTTVEVFLDTLVRAKPTHISLLTPYMLFSRGDQQHASEAITSTIITRIAQVLGVNSLIPFNLHAGQVRAQGDPTLMTIENLQLRYNIEEHILKNYFRGGEDFVVLATDAGGGKEVQKYAENLGQRMALAYKARSYKKLDTIENLEILGDINDSNVLIVDDEIDTGNSLKALIDKANSQHAKGIYIAVSHGKFSDSNMVEYFREMKKQGKIEKVIISDTILHSKEFLEENKEWLDIVHTHDTYGQAIYHLHCGKGLSELYDRQIKKIEDVIHDNGS